MIRLVSIRPDNRLECAPARAWSRRRALGRVRRGHGIGQGLRRRDRLRQWRWLRRGLRRWLSHGLRLRDGLGWFGRATNERAKEAAATLGRHSKGECGLRCLRRELLHGLKWAPRGTVSEPDACRPATGKLLQLDNRFIPPSISGNGGVLGMESPRLGKARPAPLLVWEDSIAEFSQPRLGQPGGGDHLVGRAGRRGRVACLRGADQVRVS